MTDDDFERLHMQYMEMRERIAYVEASNRRNSLFLVAAFIGLAACTALSIAYSGTARGEVFGLFGTGFGIVTALMVLASGPPMVPPTDDAFLLRLHRTSRRFYLLSFPLVAYWLGMMTWRAVSLWRLR